MKKRIFSIITVVTIIIAFSFSIALADNNLSTKLNEEEINIYNFDEEELKLQKLAKETELHRNQVAELLIMGYSEDEIKNMDANKADEILTKDMNYEEMEVYFTHVAPRPFSEYINLFPKNYFPENETITRGYCPYCGYTPDSSVDWNHATATSGYNGFGCFHEDCGTTQNNINSKCYYAKMLGMYIFNVATSSVLNFDYYMFGENYGASEPDWAHEGVDIKYIDGNGNPVRSPISGVVTVSSISNDWVSIFNEDLGITMNFQHLDNIDGLGDLKEGEEVTRGQYLGDQNYSEGHVHVQVCTHDADGDGCAIIHSGRDTSLLCVEPYGYH